MRLRLIAPVLFVVAVIAGAFAVTRIESLRDGVLVVAGGLALAAVTGALALTTERRRRAMRETERFFTLRWLLEACQSGRRGGSRLHRGRSIGTAVHGAHPPG